MYSGHKTRLVFTILIALTIMVSLISYVEAGTAVAPHKITVFQSAGGTITPKKTGTKDYVSAKDNRDALFTITPLKGYTVTSIVADAGDVTSAAVKTSKGYTYKFPKVTTDHTITATFAKISYTLKVTISGTGGSTGTVSAGTGALSCDGGICTGTYEYGTPVTLTEEPGFNSDFKSWSGCKMQASGCSVTVYKNTNVTLKFKKAKSSSITGKVSGSVQKGPFVNGASVTIYELDGTLAPTGKTFSSQTDNLGAFEIPNVQLASQYVELKADGYYFNEVSGSVSTSTITLYALVDLKDKSTVNINVLTHLERDRVKALIAKSYSFADAKKQAQKEILGIFGITKEGMASSEALDFSKDGEDNAILLAISVILQGNRTEGELSELLANINNDLEEDGTLTTAANGSALINAAKYIDLNKIKTNLTDRYKTLNVTATMPDITSTVSNFIANTTYKMTEFITYPASGSYGLNLLDKNKTDYSIGSPFSLSAVLPKGHTLKVKITGESAGGEITSANWGMFADESTGWQWGNFDDAAYSNTFTAVQTGTLDLHMGSSGGKIVVDVYEDGAITPTWTKTITVQ